MTIKIKPLEWRPGKSLYGAIHFEEAESPFGNFKVWYSDNALWTPSKAEYSRHESLDKAKAAAEEWLRNSILSCIEEA